MSILNYDISLLRRARERLDAEITSKIEQVAAGISKGDVFDYGKRCGEVRGLRDALAMLEEIAKQLQGDDRSRNEGE